ncbi:MAG: patatin-like phospholipase family protein [bacterium]|nr:patatin-like phospholipase family protein [bacterium]
MLGTDLKNVKIGVALGGGGARGFSHIGVLKVLEEADLRPRIIAGTSMGAIIGGLYAQTESADTVIKRLQLVLKDPQSGANDLNVYDKDQKGDHFFAHVTKEIKQRLIINLSISRPALLPTARLQNAVASLLDDSQIEDLGITYGALASDLITGKGVLLTRGSLHQAVIASSSIPGFFPPVKWNQYLLVDGEVTDLIPVEACLALGADFVIAVDVRREISAFEPLKHTIDIYMRTARITNHRLAEVSLEKADFVVRPIMEDVQWSEFDRLNELIAAGEWTARQRLPDLIKHLSKRNYPKYHLVNADFQATYLDFGMNNHKKNN